ncbi:MAG: 3-keto-disaccharide hydrolase [Chitinophagaceae bacterium]
MSINSFFLLVLLLSFNGLQAQEKILFQDLSSFKNPGQNWSIVSDVQASLSEKNLIRTKSGTGVLINQPKDNLRENLITNMSHGDMDMEFDFMLSKGSNSGIFLQSRYEVQLYDSWGVLKPQSGDVGGIYERWDDRKPDGQKGYEGHAPRQNVSRAPGLWQHLKISFQAPRFEGNKKIANAKILSIELNGVQVQDNLDLSGPTRAALSNDEIPEAPLMIQGDHGPIAFRNMVLRNFNKPRPSLFGLETSLYPGRFLEKPQYEKIKPTLKQQTPIISSSFSTAPDNEYLLRYKGKIKITEPGTYRFYLNTFGGGGSLSVNEAEVIPFTNWKSEGNISLDPGEYQVDLCYSKYVDWAKASLVVELEGPGIRRFTLSDTQMPSMNEADPIQVKAVGNTILRSFIDLPGGKRVVHAVNVGSAGNIHYTYDLDNGMIVQLWRGDFLDATPMWHERGDGSSRPAGSVLYFGVPALAINKLSAPDAVWMNDTAGAVFRVKGYTLDEMDRPVFTYNIYDRKVTDAIKVLPDNSGIQREIKIDSGKDNFYALLASGKSIEEISPGNFLINDKSYYLILDEADAKKPLIKEQNGLKVLIMPVSNSVRYTILF